MERERGQCGMKLTDAEAIKALRNVRCDPHLKFTESDVRQIERKNGTIAALDWLALVPPDRFDGDWQKVYDDLESALYWGDGKYVR